MACNVIIIVVSVVVALLAVVSAVLGFIAQSTKITADDIQFEESTSGVGGVCVYPTKPAYALGILALVLLVAAMIISTVAFISTVIFGCIKRPQQGSGGVSWSKLFKAVVCCVFSWVAAGLSAADYVRGVRWNAATTRDAVPMGLFSNSYGCQYLKGNGFRTSAVLSLVAALVGITSYTMLLTAPAAAAAEPKHDDGGQQQPAPPVAGVAGGSSAPLPQGQGQAHALV